MIQLETWLLQSLKLRPSALVLKVLETLQRQAHVRLDEIALYDRQIRLWGVQAQERFVVRIMDSRLN